MLSNRCAIILYQVLVIVIASSYLRSVIFSEKLQESIIKEFKAVDTNQDNHVTVDEILEHWREHVKKMTSQQIKIFKEAYDDADSNHDGKINFTEFKTEVIRVLANPDFPKIEEGIFGTHMFNASHMKNIGVV